MLRLKGDDGTHYPDLVITRALLYFAMTLYLQKTMLQSAMTLYIQKTMLQSAMTLYLRQCYSPP